MALWVRFWIVTIQLSFVCFAVGVTSSVAFGPSSAVALSPKKSEIDVGAAPAPSAEELVARRARVVSESQNALIRVDALGQGENEEVDADFFYLTGIETGGSRLLLFFDDGAVRAELFVPAKDPRWERWHGPRLTPGEETKKRTGVDVVRPLTAFQERYTELLGEATRILLPPRAPASDDPAAEHLADVRKHARGVAVGSYYRPIATARQVKSLYEIAQIRRAIAITHQGILAGWSRSRPGAWEFQVQGAIEGTFLEYGSPRRAFPSIVGAGKNSCVLHYMSNRGAMEKGDVLLLDVGASSGRYAADISRTVPVGTKFSARQREVYDVVLRAQAAAIAAVEPGATLRDVHEAARGVIDDAGLGKHNLHFSCHFVGLDVHDVSAKKELAPGMVFTIEPGVYIVEEGLGVRIEDIVLVTEGGGEVLSSAIPKKPEELEPLLKKLRRKRR